MWEVEVVLLASSCSYVCLLATATAFVNSIRCLWNDPNWTKVCSASRSRHETSQNIRAAAFKSRFHGLRGKESDSIVISFYSLNGICRSSWKRQSCRCYGRIRFLFGNPKTVFILYLAESNNGRMGFLLPRLKRCVMKQRVGEKWTPLFIFYGTNFMLC